MHGRDHLLIPETLCLWWLKHNVPGICSASEACNDPSGISRGLATTTLFQSISKMHKVRDIQEARTSVVRPDVEEQGQKNVQKGQRGRKMIHVVNSSYFEPSKNREWNKREMSKAEPAQTPGRISLVDYRWQGWHGSRPLPWVRVVGGP